MMDAKVKIHIDYYYKCEHNLSEQLKSFKQISNMRGRSFVTQFSFLPLDYKEGNKLCNNDYILLDNVILIPNLHTGKTSYNTSKILLVDLIHYTEESYNWVIKEINNLRFSKAADDNYPNKQNRIITNDSVPKKTKPSYTDEELAKIYLDCFLKSYPDDPKLKDLANEASSVSNWSKKLNKMKFLAVALFGAKELSNFLKNEDKKHKLEHIIIIIGNKMGRLSETPN